jgi:hypothetical protein
MDGCDRTIGLRRHGCRLQSLSFVYLVSAAEGRTKMLYMFILCKDPSLPEPPNVMEQHGVVEAKAKASNAYVCSAGLEMAPATATTVRIRQGLELVTDGPFAETKEIFGGFYVLDCRDLDEALAYARQIPDAQFGAVEVRPVKYPEEAWLNRAKA